MRDTITLGEMKACCEEMTAKYGTDHCCEHCEYAEMGCCNPPDDWQLEAGCVQPNWEAMFHEAEKHCHDLCMKAEANHARAERLAEENLKLRTVVSAVETMIGRKFDV